LVDVIAKYENIMPYVHLPIQSGDETILAKMNRHMKIEDYIDLVEYIRSRIPDCAISTDLIVGFPNETDEQFQNTIKLYEKNKFDNAYTFIYSKREGTPAALIEDKIPLATKEKRLEALNKLVKKYAWENCKKFIGRTIDVLVEGASKKNKNILFGYSPE
jgi:tRNA-2-methylthio-N6-dimethylallyladenosine synthase